MRSKTLVGSVLVLAIAASVGAQEKAAVTKFFDSNGAKIHFVDAGVPGGEPVVLVHGFTTNIAMQWRITGVLDTLTPDYRVIAMDCRGHGQSDKPHSPDGYGMAMADDVVRLMDHLGIKRAHLVGYSMGGRIASKVLTSHPERIISAVIAGQGMVGDESRLAPYQERLAESLESGGGLEPLLLALNPPNRPAPSISAIASLSKIYLRSQDPRALAALVRAQGALASTPDQLKANTVPTLALVGEDDPVRVKAERMAQILGHCQLRVVPGTHLTAPSQKDFKREMKAFLDGRRLTKPATAPSNSGASEK